MWTRMKYLFLGSAQFSKSHSEILCRYGFFFLGLWIMSLGVAFTVQSNLGVAPWDVLHIGLSRVTTLSIGFWVIVIGFILVVITSLLTRQLPALGTLLNMVSIGIFIDIILFFQLVPAVHNWWIRLLFLVIGIVLLCFGGGLYIAPRIGAGPRDGLMLVLSKRLGWSIRRVRTIMELSVGSIGWFLGGPIHIGTLFFCFLTGPLMQFSIQCCERILQLFLKRGACIEDIDKRTLRTHHYDGSCQ